MAQEQTQKVITLHGLGVYHEELMQRVVSAAVETTWSALKTLRDGGELVPGQTYRITDFVTTTTQEDTQSAGHAFDVIVRADSTSTLNENAYAALHSGDTYFANSKLEAWQLKYALTGMNDKEWGLFDKKAIFYDGIRYVRDESKDFSFDGTDYYAWVGTDHTVFTDTLDITPDDTEFKYCWYFDYAEESSDTTFNGSTLTYVDVDDNTHTCTRNASLDQVTNSDGDDYYAWVDDNDSDNVVFTYSATPEDGASVMYCDSGNWSSSFYFDSSDTVEKYIHESTASQIAAFRGLIYYMKDEFGNEFPYDFKNIQFKRWKATDSINGRGLGGMYVAAGTNNLPAGLSVSSENDFIWAYTFSSDMSGGVQTDYSLSDSNNIHNNVCEENGSALNNIVFYDSDNHSNTFGHGCHGNTFGFNCHSNTFGNTCYSNNFGSGYQDNTFGSSCHRNTFGSGCTKNSFGNICYRNSFSTNCQNNTFGQDCSNNTFGSSCHSNTFGDNCSNNSFGFYCHSNNFGNTCYSNNFENGCQKNTFGNYCYTNTFYSNCQNNTFGNQFYSNIIGSECQKNTFRSDCHNSNLGASSSGNVFGSSCYGITLGNGCSNNTFGSDCNNNSFGHNCQNNTFGQKCNHITLNKNFMQYIIIEGQNQYITLDCSQTTSASNLCKNIHVLQGYNNTNTTKTVTIDTLNSDKPIVISNEMSVTETKSVTYAQLKALRDGSKLVPGQMYRMTDYVTTTTQNNTQSAGHAFDVIVTADAVNKLNEVASVALHSGDTYFANCKLEAWEIKYCIDNDTTRFAWADSTNGKGVVYWMKDEFENECPYDFKNIQFKRSKAKDSVSGRSSFNNKYYGYWDSSSILPRKVTIPDNTNFIWAFTFSSSDSGGTQTDKSLLKSNNVYGNVIKTYAVGLNNNVFYGNDFYGNVLEEGYYSNTFGQQCYRNTLGQGCYANIFGQQCDCNSFGQQCHSSSIGQASSYNSIGQFNDFHTFLHGCCYVTFGQLCYEIVLAKSYMQHIIVESTNRYIKLTCSQTTSAGTYCKNIRVTQGTNDTATEKTITVDAVSQKYQTVYKSENSVEISV